MKEELLKYIELLEGEPFTGWTQKERNAHLTACKSIKTKLLKLAGPGEDVDSKDPWNWVKTDYCALFKAKNPSKGGKVRESVARMKKMFAARPEIRKEDVILTVKLYLSQTDSRFIRYPHYFLKKGQGANAIYEFDDWYDKYLESKEAGTGRTSSSNTMQ